MSDQNPTTSTDEQQVAEQAAADEAQAQAEREAAEQAEAARIAAEQQSEDALPEWARKELTKVRGEAANYRTKLRDAEARLGEAKTPEEFDAAVAEIRESNAALERELLVSQVARKFELPDELAERLRGSTKDELEADAKALQKFADATAGPSNLSGGLDPSDDDDEPSDPESLRRKYGRGRKSA